MAPCDWKSEVFFIFFFYPESRAVWSSPRLELTDTNFGREKKPPTNPLNQQHKLTQTIKEAEL